MALTRYLYIKEEVEMCLVAALLERDSLDECYYWLDELIGSGFDVRQLIWKIFYDFYFEYHPKLESYVLRKQDARPVVRQLFRLSASPTVFRRRMAGDVPPTLESLANGRDVSTYWDCASTYTDATHRLLAMDTQLRVPEGDLRAITLIIGGQFRHEDAPALTSRPYRVLRERRRYGIHRDIGALVPIRRLSEHWEYDAYETPCWKERFRLYGGVPNHTTRRVEFPSDDALEAFYERYGYEPDEQSCAVQQMALPEFIGKIENELLQCPQPHPQW